MSNWTLSELEYWDAKIRDKVAEFGLDCYPQEFEVCDQNAMLGYMAYHGMPSHYPHWSFGKSFEQTKTMYDHGVSGLPYEMVINSDPCLAYLMRDNSLCLQVLTIAHVYGHNDFFKNNFTFSSATQARETLAAFKARADRVRSYIEDPSIGGEAVETFLDAAHALSFNRSRNLAIRKLNPSQQRQRLIDAARPAPDAFAQLHKQPEITPPDLSREPLEPEEDILLFIRDHNHDLADWQRDLLTIVDEEARYFIPQIETKIMNEGWASHWHYRIMTSLDLPQEILLEFMVRHNQVICPHPGGLNPYHVGFMVWRDIERRFGGEHTPEGRAKLLEVRETDRDVSFLRRFLTEELCRDLDLFTWRPRGEHLVVSEVADEEHWQDVKNALLKQISTGTMPVIRIHDANHKHRRALYLVHEHDGRDLDMTHADKTLSHLRTLWGREVYLLTQVRGKKTLMSVTDAGFDAKLVS
ncbi:MAG: SpoVR family protein [Geminicoccaceae bacterium]